MRKNRRFMAVVSMLMIAVFLSTTQFVYAADAGRVLGDVVGTGKTEMMTSFNSWISISGKSFPVIDGTQLRSDDGRMSVILKDGVKMEASSKSEFTISGSKGDYQISLTKGSLGFSVPQGVRFAVNTPTTTVQVPTSASSVQKVSAAKETVKGFVTFDGKGTKVVAVTGNLKVQDATKVAVHTLTQGNSIYVSATGEAKTVPTQAPDQNSNDDQSGAAWWVLGGVVLFGGAAALAIANSNRGGNAVSVSPSAP